MNYQFRVVIDKRPAFTTNADGTPYMLWYVGLDKKNKDNPCGPWETHTWWFKEKDKEKDELVEVLKRVHRLTDEDVV